MTISISNTLKLAIRGAADASAAATTTRSSIGSGWKLYIYNAADNSEVAIGTASGSLGGTGANITGSVSVTFSANCDPTYFSFYVMIKKADGTVWVKGSLGLTGSGADFILSAPVTSGATSSVSFTGTLNDGSVPPSAYTFGINCGGGAFTASNGTEYMADIHANGGLTSSVTTEIPGTTDDVLYQTDRYGSISYSIPVTPSKNYRIRLHFAETWDGITGVGQRIFGYTIQAGTPQEVSVSSIDLYALVGANNVYVTNPVDVLITGSTINIALVSGVQNPKLCAIEVLALDGGAYAPVAQDSVAYIQSFRSGGHDANLGLMPTDISWATTGRYHTENNITRRIYDTRIVPWNTIFAAGNKIWPQTVGVEVGTSVLRGKRASDGVWETVGTWTTLSDYKHNRDDYGIYLGGGNNVEATGTAPTGTETQKTTSTGTKILRRANNATFPSQGTHIHGWWETGAGRVPINRSNYSKLQFYVQMRVVGWPVSDGFAPITNPSTYDGTSIVALLAADTYSADGDFNSTWGGDLGIANAKFVTTEWKTFYWYAHLASAVTTDDIPV